MLPWLRELVGVLSQSPQNLGGITLWNPVLYSVVHKKVTVLLSSMAWLAWDGCNRAELFSQHGTNFFAQPCTYIAALVAGDAEKR